MTLLAGVVICYTALYVLNLVWALFILDPAVMSASLGRSVGYDDLLVLTWFVASVATVGGAVGSGLESDEAIRAAAYSKREEERRNRLAHDRTRASEVTDGQSSSRTWPSDERGEWAGRP